MLCGSGASTGSLWPSSSWRSVFWTLLSFGAVSLPSGLTPPLITLSQKHATVNQPRYNGGGVITCMHWAVPHRGRWTKSHISRAPASSSCIVFERGGGAASRQSAGGPRLAASLPVVEGAVQG